MESMPSNGPSPPYRKSHTPVIEAAIDGCFSSRWESQLYRCIISVLQRSMLDESVTIGTVVLLDLLGDLQQMGEFTDGPHSRLQLPPYPHKDYLSFFMGAFMLAHRLLSREGPRDKQFWEEVIGEDGIRTLGEVNDLEDDFREMLEDVINDYPPPPISPEDPTYHFHYSGDVVIRSNPFIHRLRYLKMKTTMYSHIRLRMTTRGEEILMVHPIVRRKREIALYYPPCHQYMVDQLVFFAQTRREYPQLEDASDEEVSAFLEAKCHEKKTKGLVGLGLKINQ